jgi:thiol:disulfide interchange protein DsbD
MRRLLTLLLLLCSLAANCPAQTAADAKNITAQAYLSLDKLTPGARFQLAVVLQVNAPWHVNANPASGEGFIPTTLTLQPPPSTVIDRAVYPKGKKTTVSWADQPVDLYAGRTVILVEAHVRPDAATGSLNLEASLRYQACNDRVCLAPVTISLPLETEIVASSEKPQAIHPEIFGTAPPESPALPVSQAPQPKPLNQIEQLIHDRGWLFALFVVFVGGLALNLTPCVYPMIAITVSYFGGQSGEHNTRRAFVSSLVYCLGIVLTYSSLGLVAALTGSLFGSALQSPVVLVGIAVLLVALALSMFGLYELQPPRLLLERATGLSSKAGYIGVFFLGAVIGVVAAPCLAPFVVALLVFVGQSGKPLLGWWLFFVFGCGLGLPYVILGTYSGALARLPKSGMWMVWVKRVLGVVLLAVAGWFVSPLLRATTAEARSPIGWQPYSPAALKQAATDKRPVLIDFYADWCIPCKEMDRKTYPNQQVIEKSHQFLMLKADVTRTGSPEVEQLTKQFQIFGVPTTVFVGRDGRERIELRKVGYIPSEEFLDAMDKTFTAPPTATNPSPESSASPQIPAQLLKQF